MVFEGIAYSESGFIFIGIGVNGKKSDGVNVSGSTLCNFLEDF